VTDQEKAKGRHTFFPSQSESGDEEADKGTEETPQPDVQDRDKHDVEGDEEEEEEEVDAPASSSSPYFRRSDYVGRGNLKAVRDARRLAGLSDHFPRSDPLLVEFARDLSIAGAAQRDVKNKVGAAFYMLSIISKSYLKLLHLLHLFLISLE